MESFLKKISYHLSIPLENRRNCFRLEFNRFWNTRIPHCRISLSYSRDCFPQQAIANFQENIQNDPKQNLCRKISKAKRQLFQYFVILGGNLSNR